MAVPSSPPFEASPPILTAKPAHTTIATTTLDYCTMAFNSAKSRTQMPLKTVLFAFMLRHYEATLHPTASFDSPVSSYLSTHSNGHPAHMYRH